MGRSPYTSARGRSEQKRARERSIGIADQNFGHDQNIGRQAQCSVARLGAHPQPSLFPWASIASSNSLDRGAKFLCVHETHPKSTRLFLQSFASSHLFHHYPNSA
jgi:hypothetical protein